MSWFAQAVVAGMTSFVVTNIDDILILMLFFAQVNATLRPKHILIGQYLGFTVLIILSLPGFFGGLMVSKEWIGLLGLMPIAIGIKHLLAQKLSNPKNNETAIQLVPDERSQPKADQPLRSELAHLGAPQTYQVATVTIANGGDNVSVYVPLFASSNLPRLSVILSVFLIMVGVWCAIAYHLTRHPLVAQSLTRRGDALVPYVLIGLGIFILIDSETYRLLQPFL